MNRINVLQFICPVGFYGAERWIIALVNNSDNQTVCHHLAVTDEAENQDLQITEQFPKGAGKVHRIKMKNRFDYSVIKHLMDIIENNNIHIIHTHGYKSDILGLIVAKKAKIKCVSTPHGFGQPTDIKLKMFVKFGAWSLKYFDCIAPLSAQLYNEVLKVGIRKSKITYIQNGVDLKELDPYLTQKRNRSPVDKKIIGFIGQMIPRKNIKDLLDIFDNLQNDIPNVELQLLGDGESRHELEKYSYQLKSSSKIKFLGFRQDRLDYLKNFDLFAMTSKDEGIPRCLMEAMALEVPVAAYNIQGVDQLLEHGKTGLLCEFGNKQYMKECWVSLLTDDELSGKLAKNARVFIDDNFSARRMSNEYLKLFKSIIKRSVH